MASIKQEKRDAKDGDAPQSTQPSETAEDMLSRKKRPSTATEEPRRSKRQRAAPKMYHETSKPQRKGRGGQWKEEELEKLLDCLKKNQRADNVRCVKKHVKTKNLEQVEAKLENLRKKALERAMDETVGMPPLQCWEMLAKDITNTLGDESYKELSKVFWTATAENKRKTSSLAESNQPNYNEIYKFLAALLRGTSPPELSPINSMIVLECLNNTVEFLQHLKIQDQSAFLQKRYQEHFLSLYSNEPDDKPGTSSASAGSPAAGTSSSEDVPIGLGSLNPFNIPVDKLNLIRPPPCEEHGNLYCWLPGCREKHKTQQPSSSSSE